MRNKKSMMQLCHSFSNDAQNEQLQYFRNDYKTKQYFPTPYRNLLCIFGNMFTNFHTKLSLYLSIIY